MAQFVGNPNVEVNGETVYAIVDGMGIFKSMALELLAENGIEAPRPGTWFSQQKWLDAFKIISDKLGAKTLFDIGSKIPKNAIFPADIVTMEQALQSIDVAYHINHRNGDIGEYRYESNGLKSAKMICRNPYPCAFDRGIIAAMVKRFKPKDSLSAAVTHDDSAPCRVKGDESCTYLVNW